MKLVCHVIKSASQKIWSLTNKFISQWHFNTNNYVWESRIVYNYKHKRDFMFVIMQRLNYKLVWYMINVINYDNFTR